MRLLYKDLKLRLRRDDGAVVYLNGTEVARSNMPSAEIGYTTPASSTISGGDENTFNEFVLTGVSFETGVNVLAVEIHQSSTGSSDISFDLELVATMPAKDGDFNLDGTVNGDDLDLLQDKVANGENDALFDLNDTGTVTNLDISYFARYIIKGDYDFDGDPNLADINAMRSAIAGSSTDPKYDLNLSGGVATTADKDVLIQQLIETQYGDANLDRIVNISDLSIVAVNFGQTSGMEWNHGNFDNDTDVDITDLATLATWFGFDNSEGGGGSPFTSSIDIYDDGGSDVGSGLYKYIVTLETSGETDIQAIQLQIVADDAGTLNQQYPDICCGPMGTLFQNNNVYFPYDENVDLDHDSQWLWETGDLMIIWEDYESNVLTDEDDDQLIGTFAVGPSNGFLSRDIAQIVLPEGTTATVTGTIAFADGSYEEVGPFVIGGSEFLMGGGGSGSMADVLDEASRGDRRDERPVRQVRERRVTYAGAVTLPSRVAENAASAWAHIRRAIELV